MPLNTTATQREAANRPSRPWTGRISATTSPPPTRDGRRKWIYPRKVSGRFYRWRTWFSWLLLAIMFAGPFITIHGNPLLLMNIVERKFVVLGQIFWPQDMIIFAIAVLVVLHRHHHFHRRVWPALVRLGLSADRDDGNGLPQNRIRSSKATRPSSAP